MKISRVYEDPALSNIEQQIILTSKSGLYTSEGSKHIEELLQERACLLHSLQQCDEECAALLIEFNAALRKAQTEAWYRTYELCREYQSRTDYLGKFSLETKVFLSYDYPLLHPVQSEQRKMIWEILTASGLNPLYDDGCGGLLLGNKDGLNYKSLNSYLNIHPSDYESDEDNWNEGLDREWSKQMHLVYAFHNLYEHLNFSLYDLIYVRDFDIDINLSFEGRICCVEKNTHRECSLIFTS